MRIGAHVSASGGIEKAIDRAQAIGAEALQVFATAPQAWRINEHSSAATDAFVQKANEAGIGPVFLHGIYLVNLGTDSDENLAKGIASLVHYMNFCTRIDARGVVFHVGGHRGSGLDAVLDRMVVSIRTVLENSPDGIRLCLENNSGKGDQVGGPFNDLARIIHSVDDPRLGVCLDTCHAFAAGYDISKPSGLKSALDEFDAVIGLDKLVVVHANDSKGVLGGTLDRHENIGDGAIGLEGWRTIMSAPAFRDVPFILEVPGIDGKSGPDLENVDRLKAIRTEAQIPR
ncbi:MAG: deoxyribonuclease IV [Chloroflexi bacterium]|nr:deoxyribonuclease IV [Chloroflexota bacterium]